MSDAAIFLPANVLDILKEALGSDRMSPFAVIFTPWRPRMGRLFDTIRQLVGSERYVIGEHASERLEERGILEWQVVSGLDDGELIVERPNSKPNPTVEVRECLADGTEIKAVWSYLRQTGVAKLVTVHFFDRD
jgi:hypothetical protein